MKKLVVIFSLFFAFPLWGQQTLSKEQILDSLQTHDYPEKIGFQFELVRMYMRTNPDTAKYLLDKYYKEGAEFYNPKNKIIHHQLKGYTYYFEAKFDSAVSQLEKSVKYAEASPFEDKEVLLPSLYNALGVMYQRWGYGVKAAEYTSKAIAIHNENKNTKGAAVGYNNLSALYREQKEFKRAIEAGKKAAAMHVQLKDTLQFAGSYNNIGLAFNDLHQRDSARFYFELSLSFRDSAVDPRGFSNVLNNLGLLYVKEGELSRGKDLFDKALQTRAKYQDEYGMAKCYLNLVDWAIAVKDYQGAKAYIDKAEALSHGIGSLSFQIELLDKKLDVLEYLKDYKAVTKEYKEFLTLRDSLYNIDRGREIGKMEAEMESALAKNELEALKRENEIDEQTIKFLFLVGCIMTLLALVLVYVGIRLRRQKDKLNELHETLEENHAEVVKEAEERSQILSYMSHEIRTPLGGIISLAMLNQDETDSKMVHENNQMILDAGYQLLEMINKVLDFARIESGKVALDLKTIWVYDSWAKALELFQSMASEKGLSLQNNCSKEVAILADPDLFQMLASNFVSNAIKYCDKGSITINSWIETGNVVMSITDTGIGMSEEDLTRLFQAYTRVGDTNSTNRQGTGLGLTLSLRIAQLHHGDIRVESEKGKGTTFYITWPLS